MTEAKVNLDLTERLIADNKKQIEGVDRIPLKINSDDRGHLIEICRTDWPKIQEILPAFPESRINQVYIVHDDRRDIVRAFHKHSDLWDLFSIVNGSARFVLVDDRPISPTYGVMNEYVLGQRNMSMLIVPPGVFHGWMSLEDNTILASIASHTYNQAKPDEVRIAPNSFQYDWSIKGR